jgi:hypothetical protein
MPGFLGIGRRHRGAPQWKSRSFHRGRVAVNSNHVDFRRHSLHTGRHVQARERLCGILENGRLPLTYTGIQIPAPDLEEIGFNGRSLGILLTSLSQLIPVSER